MRKGRIPAILLAVMLSVCSCKSEVPVQDTPTEIEQPAKAVSSIEREITRGPVRVVVRLTPEKPIIGDSVTLSLEVDSEADVRVDMPEFGDQLGRFNISSFRPSQEKLANGHNLQKQTYVLDLPMSGKLRMPSFLVEFVDERPTAEDSVRGKIQEILTEEVTFEVESVLSQDSLDKPLNALKGDLGELVMPDTEKKDQAKTWLYIVLSLIALGASAGVFVYLRKKRKVIALPPHIIALSALDELNRQGMPKGEVEVDAWYVALSDILRTYVEGRFSLHAPRMTTEEFFELAKSSDALKANEKSKICDLLRRSDRVKFAGFHPGDNENREMLEDTRHFVEETQPIELADGSSKQ